MSTLSIITLEPQNPVRYYQLGVLEAARQDVVAATAAFERAVQLDQNYANARYLLALAYDAQNKKAEAIVQLEKVLDLNPENADIVRLIEILENGGNLSASVSQQSETTAVSETLPVDAENGTVTTEVNPDTPLVSPVNTVPEAASQEQSSAGGAQSMQME
jgi:tetratricopeptide (TPR) repeat protein